MRERRTYGSGEDFISRDMILQNQRDIYDTRVRCLGVKIPFDPYIIYTDKEA